VVANDNPSDYPTDLRTAEEELIKKRPERKNSSRADWVGVGLSGGGIRSATFCLGVFQALGALGLLRKIDYTSSVSGGGYFASFYGRLFTREKGKDADGKDFDGVKDVDEVARILAPNETEPPDGSASAWKRGVFRWLRANGRYLAPNGAGDLLLDLTGVIRNWISLQVVIASFILMLLLVAQLLRAEIQQSAQLRQWGVGIAYHRIYIILPGADYFWWSPYTVVALAIFVLMAIPLGWSYWLVAGLRRSGRLKPWSWLAPILFIAAQMRVGRPYSSPLLGFVKVPVDGWIVYWIAGFTLVFAIISIAWARCKNGPGGVNKNNPNNIDLYDKAADWLSAVLKNAMIVALGLFAFALIDSLGQQAYLHGFRARWVVSLFGPIVIVAPFIKSLLAYLPQSTGVRHVGLPLGLLAGVGALIIIVPVLVLLDGVSHGVAYDFATPAAPVAAIHERAPSLEAKIEASKGKITGEYTQSATAKPDPDQAGQPVPIRMCRRPIAVALFAIFVLSFIAGRMRGFMNTSTLLSLYRIRLVRAYLGASNPDRLKGRGRPVIEAVPGDDIAQEDYWSPQRTPPNTRKYENGAPLHLVNVTLNETYGGRSETEQHDRKGLGMAIGPAGISVGVKDHVIFNSSPPADAIKPQSDDAPIYNGVTISPPSGSDEVHRAFDYADNVYVGQRLALGSWTGISGAAVSTGLGYRSSIALSLLVGFFNIRLGYWWDSGISRHARHTKSSDLISRLFQLVFPVQRQLLNEFLSRFPGTSEQYWYLTDGGHFENMGGYELIRRRLPLIVIIDAEGDENYTFPGLAGLIQKARLDFGAEIKFLNGEQLDDRLGKYHTMRQYFGTLNQLRRGTWTEEPVDDPDTAKSRLSLAPPGLDAFSLAHAALAQITYADDTEGLMIVIKPTLTGDEPADLLHYHGEHPTFPHESTADQFFDEAQWESYRKLGEHIATQLFEWNDEKKPFPSFTA
jgi:hypothetical protein